MKALSIPIWQLRAGLYEDFSWRIQAGVHHPDGDASSEGSWS